MTLDQGSLQFVSKPNLYVRGYFFVVFFFIIPEVVLYDKIAQDYNQTIDVLISKPRHRDAAVGYKYVLG